MKRIWFNHWFSTAYNIIDLVRKNDDEQFYIIGSNIQNNSVIQLKCDEWYTEPVEETDYLSFCLDFCKTHKIDIFISRRCMNIISENISLFTEINTKVLLDDYSVIKLLNDKAKTYEFLKDIENIHIPKYRICNTAKDFEDNMKYFKENNIDACVKFVKDEGARSFRRIINQEITFDSIKSYSKTRISYNDYLECLKLVSSFDDLMIMEYLPDNEISVDCLQTPQGLIAIPRYKTNTRAEYIKFDEDIIELCKKIVDKIGIVYPCNIQFKLKDNIPYLLEINSRMSGGIQLSCLATGVNIPNIAVNKLLNNNKSWNINKCSKLVSFIETPLIIE